MTSAVTICNMALVEIGSQGTIQSLDEATPEAGVCSLFFDECRRQILRAAPWNFARKFTALTLLKAAPGTPESTAAASDVWLPSMPPAPWLYTYAQPSDAVFVRYVTGQYPGATPAGIPIFPVSLGIQPEYRAVNFIVTSDLDTTGNPIQVIATNAMQALVCYNYDATNPNNWDTLFVEAMRCALAGKICMKLTGRPKTQMTLYQMANAAIMQARAADGNEGLTQQDIVPDWIKARSDGSPAFYQYYAPWGPLFPVGGMYV